MVDVFNVNEYIECFRNNHPSPRLFEDEYLSKIFKSLAKTKNCSYREIYSTTIYPQYLSVNEQDVIAWDSLYWDLFERYLYGIWQIEDSSQFPINTTDYFFSIICLFLSLRFESVPIFSLVFAKHYAGTGFAVLPFSRHEKISINSQLQNSHFAEVLCLCKVFAFLHELAHCISRRDDDYHSEIFSSVKDLCKQITTMPWPFADTSMRDAAIAISNGKEKKLTEEVCCDLYAILSGINIANNLFPQESHKDAFIHYTQSMRYLIAFQISMNQVEDRFNFLHDLIDNNALDELTMDEVDRRHSESRMSVHIRNGLSYCLAGIYLKFEDLHSTDNILDTDFFRTQVQPAFNMAMDSVFIDSFVIEYIDIYGKFSDAQLSRCRDMLVGWY